jgi:hypothetical protein
MIDCARLHFNICKEIGVPVDNVPLYKNVSKFLKSSHEGQVAVLWNQQVQIDSRP